MAQNKYITVAEWGEGFDDRLLAQLSSDTGTPGTVDESNAVLLHCIERASADVESATLRGERYTETDLTALQTDDDFTLKGLVIDLATMHLFGVRGIGFPEHVQRMVDRGKDKLEALATGKRIFRHDSNVTAGAPVVHITPASRRSQLKMVSDSAFFPAARTTEAT